MTPDHRHITKMADILRACMRDGKPNLAAWWARMLFRYARRCGMLVDYERGL